MKFILKDFPKAREMVSKMSREELINQCVCPNFMPGNLAGQSEYGAIFIHAGEKEQLKNEIQSYKEKCDIPPLIAGDFESGPSGMMTDGVKFPSQMGMSQMNSPENSYKLGKLTAKEMLDTGYNWNFSPCVDIAAVSLNPIVLSRSYGETPEQVTKISKEYMKGMQSEGVAATGKHFPGDGYDYYDQHLTTTVNPLGMDEWRGLSGRCFKELIDEGVCSIMTGHISLPSYDNPDEETGLCPPATISRRLMTDLLRGELGFRGIIVSDAINMGGAVGFKNYYETCALFWENGGDILLFPKMDGFHEEIYQLMDKGVLSLETLRDRAYRVLCFKEQMGVLSGVGAGEKVQTAEFEKLLSAAVDSSITLVRDRAGLIPQEISRDTKVLHLIILNEAERHKKFTDSITAGLTKYSDFVTEASDPGPDRLFIDVKDGKYDLIICTIGNSLAYGTNVGHLHGPVARNMMGGWMRLGVPVIFIAPFEPFVHKEYAAAIGTIINTYGVTKITAQKVLDKIFEREPINTVLSAHS